MTESHRNFHRQLITQWINTLLNEAPLNSINIEKQLTADSSKSIITQHEDFSDQPDHQFVFQLHQLAKLPGGVAEQTLGQRLITTCITSYPHWVGIIPRDLFWYFGGDCMHFLGDEEIEQFQRLDELSVEKSDFTTYEALRRHTLNLN